MAGNDHGAAPREQFGEPGLRQLDRRPNRTRNLDENERDLLNRVMRRAERQLDSFGERNNWFLERRRRMNVDMWPRSWIVHYPPAVRIDSSDFSDGPATDEDPPHAVGTCANFEPSSEDSTPKGLRPPDQQPTRSRRTEEPVVRSPLHAWFSDDDDSLDRPTGESAARSRPNTACADAEESSSDGVVATRGDERDACKHTEQLDPFEQDTGEKPPSRKSIMDPRENPITFEDWVASNPTQHMTKRERRRNRPVRMTDNAPEEYFALDKLPFRAAPRDAVIPVCHLDLDHEHRVMIEEVRGPTDYTVRLVDLVHTYYDFQANVAWRYNAELRKKYALSNSGPLKAGRACVVMHSITYIHSQRAVVESFDLIRRTAEVTLVDKAGREEVPIENLVQLDESMLEHPISAFRITDPSCDVTYPPETNLSMRVKRIMSDVMEVELIPDSDPVNRKKALQRKMPATQRVESTATRQHGVPAATTREQPARARSKTRVLPTTELRHLRLDNMEHEHRSTARPARTFQPGTSHALRRNDRMSLEFCPERNAEAGREACRIDPVELEPCSETEDFRSGFAVFMGQQNDYQHRVAHDAGTSRQRNANADSRSRPCDTPSARHYDPADGRQRSLLDGRHLDREGGSFAAPFGGFAPDLSPRENARRVGSGYDQPSRPVRYERHRNAEAHYERAEYDRQDGVRYGKGQMHHHGSRDVHRRRNDFRSHNFGGNGRPLPAVGPWASYNQPHNPNADERSFFYTALLDPTNDNRPRGSGARPPRRS